MSTRRNTSKHSSGHGAGTEEKKRDEQKSETKKKSAIKEMIESGELLLCVCVLNDEPSCLEKAEYNTIRKHLLNLFSNHSSFLSSPIMGRQEGRAH